MIASSTMLAAVHRPSQPQSSRAKWFRIVEPASGVAVWSGSVSLHAEDRPGLLHEGRARSLQDAGLPFDDAYRLASTIRDELSDLDQVTTDELRADTVVHLKHDFAPEIVEHYRSPTRMMPTIMVHDQAGRAAPFSRGQHGRYLESSGLRADKAGIITRRIHDELVHKRIEEISSAEVSP